MFRISRWLLDRLTHLDIDPDALLCHSGLPPDLFDPEVILVNAGELFSIYRAVADLGSLPCIGLHLVDLSRLENLPPAALGTICQRSLRDAIGWTSEFIGLTGPEEISLSCIGGEASVELVFIDSEGIHPDVRTDLIFSWIHQVARYASGDRIWPRKIELRRGNKNRGLLERHFGCPVVFDGESDVLYFREQDLDIPFETENTMLSAMLKRQLEIELRSLVSGLTVSDHVERVLRGSLRNTPPRLDQVAAELGMPARTLQRRLFSDKTSFSVILEKVRHQIARHHLRNYRIEIARIASLLGYEDTSSFSRVFQMWEGITPGEWRSLNGFN